MTTPKTPKTPKTTKTPKNDDAKKAVKAARANAARIARYEKMAKVAESLIDELQDEVTLANAEESRARAAAIENPGSEALAIDHAIKDARKHRLIGTIAKLRVAIAAIDGERDRLE